jgi:hypothetical protein
MFIRVPLQITFISANLLASSGCGAVVSSTTMHPKRFHLATLQVGLSTDIQDYHLIEISAMRFKVRSNG